MDVTVLAAIVFAVATAGVIAFQIALALGVPWGSYAMGGRFPGRFPPGMRVAALVQAALQAGLATIVLSRAGLLLPTIAQSLPWLTWVAVAVSAASLLMNAITPSAGERRIWVPVALILLASSVTVALSAG